MQLQRRSEVPRVSGVGIQPWYNPESVRFAAGAAVVMIYVQWKCRVPSWRLQTRNVRLCESDRRPTLRREIQTAVLLKWSVEWVSQSGFGPVLQERLLHSKCCPESRTVCTEGVLRVRDRSQLPFDTRSAIRRLISGVCTF